MTYFNAPNSTSAEDPPQTQQDSLQRSGAYCAPQTFLLAGLEDPSFKGKRGKGSEGKGKRDGTIPPLLPKLV